jgi:GNAT superfamily N-acetyltransferase
MTAADGPAAARALAAAFADDPHTRWVFRDDERRPAQLERGYAALIAHAWLPRGEGHIVGGGEGAALWMRPGEWHLGASARLRLLPSIVRLGPPTAMRLLTAANAMDRHHPHEEHWYLPIVGVTPEAQGRGLGSALLRPVLDRCDADGLPAYLEASTARSRAL